MLTIMMIPAIRESNSTNEERIFAVAIAVIIDILIFGAVLSAIM